MESKGYTLAVKDRSDLLEGLGHVEADVGHLVVGHLEDHRQHLLGGNVLAAGLGQGLEDKKKRRNKAANQPLVTH